MFSTTLTTGTGFPDSRTSFTRDPLLGLRSHPPWRTAIGSLRSSFEAFTLFPCYGVFGCTSNPTHPVRSNGPARIVRCVLVATSGLCHTVPWDINLSAPVGGGAHPRLPVAATREAGGEPPRSWYERSRRSWTMHGRSDSAAGPVTGRANVDRVGIQMCRPNSQQVKLRPAFVRTVVRRFGCRRPRGRRLPGHSYDDPSQSSSGGRPSSFRTVPSSSTVTTPRLFTAYGSRPISSMNPL